MPILLAPIGLVALAALALPLLVHLVRRSERRPVDFAALRWVSERHAPHRQWHLHEPGLLALRALLLALLALLLAGPAWRTPDERQNSWVAVAPGLDPAAARAAVPSGAAAEWHWLAPGDPAFDAPVPMPMPVPSSPAGRTAGMAPFARSAPVTPLPFTSLVRALDAELPPKARLTLVVPQTLVGLDAQALQLLHTVDWRVLGPAASPEPLPAPAPDALTVSVRLDARGAAELPLVRALVRSWQVDDTPITLDVAAPEVPLPPQARLAFWLAATPPAGWQPWVEAGGTALLTRSPSPAGRSDRVDLSDMGDPEGTAQASLRETPLGRGRWLRLATALTVADLPLSADPAFAARLGARLLPAPPAPDRALAAGFAPVLSGRPIPGPITPWADALALLGALLFVIERWVASGPRRGAE